MLRLPTMLQRISTMETAASTAWPFNNGEEAWEHEINEHPDAEECLPVHDLDGPSSATLAALLDTALETPDLCHQLGLNSESAGAAAALAERLAFNFIFRYDTPHPEVRRCRLSLSAPRSCG